MCGSVDFGGFLCGSVDFGGFLCGSVDFGFGFGFGFGFDLCFVGVGEAAANLVVRGRSLPRRAKSACTPPFKMARRDRASAVVYLEAGECV